MQNNRIIWLILMGTLLFFGAAVFTLRAAEQAAQRPAPATVPASPAAAAPASTKPRDPTSPSHPAPAAPEESATIADDPTTAPDPAQSADNNVSFPTDI